MRFVFLSFFLLVLFAPADAQTLSCASVFTDLAGENNAYEAGISHSDTISASAGFAVQLEFSQLNLAEFDTLFLIDPLFPESPIAALTQGSSVQTYQSFSHVLIANFVSQGIAGADGWIAHVNCISAPFLSTEIYADTLCAGFEGFVDWDILFPFPPETQIIYELSNASGSFSSFSSIGESFVADDSMYLQLGADVMAGDNYRVRFYTNNPTYDSLTFQIPVLVRRLPNQPIIDGVSMFCGDTVQLSTTSQIRIDFQWYLNEGPINTLIPTVLETNVGGIYRVEASNLCGVVSSSNYSLTYVDPPSVPVLSQSAEFLCPNDTVLLSLSPSADTSAIAWFNGQSQINNPSDWLNIMQGGNYFIRRSNFCGTVYSDTLEIIQYASPPVATISSLGNLQFCQGESVVLAADSLSDLSPAWLLDGSMIGTSFSHQAASAGTYYLQLSNVCGTVNSGNQLQVSVLPQPTPAILSAAGPTTLCEGNSVLLMAQTSNNDAMQWYNLGQAIDNGNQHSAIISGTYSVVSSNACGLVNSANTILVQINPLPAVPMIFNIGNPALCNGSTINLFVNQDPANTYTWRRNGAFHSTGVGSITVTQAGVYSITATNSCGTVTSQSPVSVTNSNPPIAPAIAANGITTFCQGLSVTLQTPPQNGALFRWLLNGSPTGTNNFSIQANQAGLYTLEISNACDTVLSVNSIQVNVNPLPQVVSISPTTEQSICEGQSVQLSIPAIAGISYQWRRNGSAVGQNQAQITVTTEGLYSLSVANSCGSTTASNTVYLNVDSLQPTLQSIIPQPGTALCMGGYVLLNAQPVPFQTYSWYLNGALISGQVNPVLQATQWGLYTVQANNACGISNESSAVTLGPGDAPIPFAIYSTNGLSICSNDSLALTAQVEFGVGIRWYRNGELYADGPAQIHVNQAGVYTAFAYNGCGEADGTNSLSVSVLTAPDVPVIQLNGSALTTTAIGILQWYNSALVALPNANSSSYLPAPVNAAYSVSVTNTNGCTAYSAPFNYIVNGLELLVKPSFSIYPNPASNFITFEGLTAGRLSIFDLSGKLVWFENVAQNQTQIRISTEPLSKGVYFVAMNAEHLRLVVR